MAEQEDITTGLLGPEETQVETETETEVTQPEVEVEAKAEPVVETVVQSDPAQAGMLRDLQAERAKRQQAEAEAQEAKAMLAAIRDNRPAVEQSAAEEETEFDAPTTRAVEKIATQRAKEIARQIIMEHDWEQSTRVAKADPAMVDFDAVIGAGAKNLLPGDRQHIGQSGLQSAHELYRLCIDRTPELRTQRDAKRDQALIEKTTAEVLKNLQTPNPKTPAAKPPAPTPKPVVPNRQPMSLSQKVTTDLLGPAEE